MSSGQTGVANGRNHTTNGEFPRVPLTYKPLQGGPISDRQSQKHSRTMANNTKPGMRIALGVAIGVAIGVAMGNVAMGIGIGIAIGIAMSFVK